MINHMFILIYFVNILLNNMFIFIKFYILKVELNKFLCKCIFIRTHFFFEKLFSFKNNL
jgi:hypothetical protein